jgi:nitrite reductase/ring-hydroxylating ferredoxin subunit
VLRSEDCVAGTDGEPRFVEVSVGGADLLVARLSDGDVVAFAAVCPHLATPLEGATLRSARLRCARHLYEYDVRTGENVVPARQARPDLLWKLRPGYLAVHRVEERDGWIRVATTPEPPPTAYDAGLERRPGDEG